MKRRIFLPRKPKKKMKRWVNKVMKTPRKENVFTIISDENKSKEKMEMI